MLNKYNYLLLIICLLFIKQEVYPDESKELDNINNPNVDIPLHPEQIKTNNYYKNLQDSLFIVEYSDYINYTRQSYTDRLNKLNWQAISNIIIFIVVLIVVMLGVIASGIQFAKSVKKTEIDIEKSKIDPVDIEIGLTQVKLKTSLIAIIILVISIVFFFLYLSYVYPLSEVSKINEPPKVEMK